MHERPIGDLVDALRAARLRDRLPGQRGYPPLRVSARPAALALDAPIRVRGDVSSQFLTALLLALPLARRAGDVVDRGRGRADLQALRRDHAEAAGALRHRRRSARAGSASRSPPASGYRSPGRIHRRGRRVVGVVLHRRSARSARSRRAAAHRRRRQRLDPGRHRLRRRGAGDGRRHRTRRRGWLEVRRGRWPLAAIDARLQPHPRRRDDARRDGALRRRHDDA